MARLTGGVYVRAGTPPATIERLYTEHIARQARRHLEIVPGEYLVHRYHWFVLAALLLLAVDMLVWERKKEGEAERGRRKVTGTQRAVGLVVLWGLPALGQAASPYDAVQQGNSLYQAGQYEAAAQQYATAAQALPEAVEIHFNQGNAFFKQQDYAKALEHYARALPTPDRTLASRVRYNLGNVKYQQALQALLTSQDAVTPLRAAMTYYRDSLEIDSQYQEARYNLELAYVLLRQIQPQQGQDQGQQENQPQGTSQPQEQPSQPQAPQQETQRQEAQQQTSQEPQSQHAERALHEHAALDSSDAQLQPTPVPQELSPEEAERLLEAIRQRAQEADLRRQQWRRASRARAAKDW
jgi:Ca-activated chloride channel family protein